MGDKNRGCNVTIEQECHWGDTLCGYPFVFMENSKYFLKENDQVKGHIIEDSSYACRLFIPANMRSGRSKIKTPGGEFDGEKLFKLGYYCPCCYCMCK